MPWIILKLEPCNPWHKTTKDAITIRIALTADSTSVSLIGVLTQQKPIRKGN